MLNFGSVKTEIIDHHQLYNELVAFEHSYGRTSEDALSNVPVEIDVDSNTKDEDAAGDSEGMLLSVLLNRKTIYDLFLCHQRIVLLLFFHYWYFNFYLSESVSLLYTEPYRSTNKCCYN